MVHSNVKIVNSRISHVIVMHWQLWNWFCLNEAFCMLTILA